MTTVEWNNAPEVRAFYGRAEEVGELASELLGTDRRLVMIQGLRGSGKTRLSLAAVCVRTNAGLATDLQSEVVGRFDHVVWASLLNAPTLVDLLRRIAGSLPPTAGPPTSDDEAGMVDHILAQARAAPCLIILDNLESVLEAGSGSPFRLDHEGYGEFLARFAAARHHSCILVTSREIPTSLADRCGPREPAIVHRVRPLNEGACASILADHGLRAEIGTLRRLVQAFGGNPLMIDLVARRAREVYGDDLDRLLDEGDLCFDRVRELLAWHFDRLTPRELGLAYRFAVSREAIGLGEMAADLGVGQAVAGDVLRELEARLPLERHGERRTMHPVLMEHVTDRLVAEAIQDAISDPPGVLDRVSLYKATGKDYVRAAQERLLLAPISRGLAERVGRMPGVSGLLSAMLRAARGKGGRGHLAGNAINLMWAAGIDISGLDMSSLPIRDAFLQRITLHGCDFSFSEFHGCVFATTLGTVLSVAVTPDGASVLTGDNHGDVRSWRTADGAELTRFEGHRDWVRTIAAAPGGTTFATAGSDYEIRIWETSTGHCLHVLRGHAEQVYSVHYDPTGRLLASGAEDGQVILWDASNSYQRIREWRCEGRVRSVRFSPRKECVLVGCKDVEILPVVGDGPLAVSAVDGHVRRAVFDPSGETVAYATEAGTVHVADGGTLRELRRLDLPRKPNWIEYSLDGSTLAAGCEDGRIRRWSVAQAYAGMPDLDGAPGASIRAIAFGPDPGLIASGGEDRTVRLWDLRSREVLRSVQGYANGIRSVAWAADGASFAAACEDGEVRSWDVAHSGPTPSGRLQGHTGTVEAVTFDPSGHALASAGDDGTVRIWDLATGRSRTLRGHRGWIWCATYSRDGRLLATGGRDHRVLVWDTADGAQLHELADHDDEVHCVEFLGTTGLIATGGDDKRVRLWQPGESGARVIGAHGDCVRALCFSEPRGLLASAGDDGVVKLWTLDGQAAGEMAGHRGRIRSIVFDRSGQTLFSAGDDAVIRKWDVDRRTAKEFCGHSGGLWSVALSPEGDALVSGGAEGVLRIWDVASGQSSERWPERRYEGACMAGVQGLTPAEVHSLERLGATMRKRASDGDRTPLSPPDATAPTSAEASGIGQAGVSAAGGSEPGPPATPASAREEDGPSDIVDAGPALRTTSPITTRLLDVLISIRPLGPDETLWTEAGGDFARLNLIGNGREQWSTALRELGLGGGGKDITVLSLVDAALANYPRNPGLQTLRAELVMGGPS